MAIDDHRLVHFDAVFDYGDILIRPRDLHVPFLRDLVRADDECVGALGTVQHSSRRNGHDVLARSEAHPHIDELARPKHFVRVFKHRLVGDGRGRGIDLIVDDAELTRRKRPTIRAFRRYRDLAGLVFRSYGDQRIRRHREGHIDRPDLVDDDDSTRVRSAHHIAGIKHADACLAIDG